MSYPVLRISDDCDHVEVRKGRGAAGWNQLTEIFSGPADAGQEWRGGEGDKLSAKYRMPTGSNMSLPYTVSSTEGLETGKPEILLFPDGRD